MADADDDGFIGLPPGISDLSAFRPPEPERPRPERADIVFVPTTPGLPIPPPSAAASDHEPAPAADDEPAPAWRLVLPDGSGVAVTSTLLVGRNPAPFPEWPGATLLPVDDATHSVSKTHAAIEVDASGLWVHDLNSTNGVWVVHGGDVTEASPGRRVNAPLGSTIELGDYRLTVASGAAAS